MSLRRDMPQLIEHAVARGLPYAIHTHGAHVERLRDVFAAHPPDLAAISLDGVEAEHDRFRGRAGSFAAALRAIRMLAECGCPEIVVGTTVTRQNADHMAALHPIVVASGAHTWGMHLFAPEGRGAEHRALLPTADQLRRVVEFVRRRRSSFHVELCNEWGSAGADDVYLRDQPFACGAGRISFVIASNGDVMPCTTTDAAEREGNVRERPLHEIWARGFTRFRRPGTDPALDPRECWLQTRNGVEIRKDAFGIGLEPPPLPIDRLTRRLVAALRPTADDRGAVASPRATRAIRWAAVGLTFLDACVRDARTDGAVPQPSEPSKPIATTAAPPPADAPLLDELALGVPDEFPEAVVRNPGPHFVWQANGGAWPRTMTAILQAEAGRARWSAIAENMSLGVGPLRDAIVQHARAQERGEPIDLAALVGLLNQLEAVPTYDPAFAAYLWRRARSIENPDLRQRTTLFARLHHHLRVADALTQAQAQTAPVTVSAWRSKAAPPEGWLQEATVPDGLVPAARKWFDERHAPPWDRVAATLELVDGRATLLGHPSALHPGAKLQLRRLDTLYAHTELHLATPDGPSLRVPAGTYLTLDALPSHLDDDGRREMTGLVERAAAGGTATDARVLALLPWAHAAIRARLLAHSGDPGAGKLQLWLVMFDE
jgi:MoaA/NifB/PqqE/SkfB family radical SAM enzyme